MPTPRTICVYCGSSASVPPKYLHLAAELGQSIGKNGHTLVWGGGSVGLMGEVARAAKAHGARVIGVIPRFLVEKEIAFSELDGSDEMIVTDTMSHRKTIMVQRSDAFIVLPGGFGTLEEMFETMTLRTLQQHDKPLVLLNHHGFYDGLLNFIEHLYENRFAREHSRAHYHVAHNVPAVFEHLDAHHARPAGAPA